MTLIEKALIFATEAHSGQLRKDGRTQFILHPAEVASIAATLTDKETVVAACILHDTVEDTDTTIEEIEREFGSDVAAIVAGDTEDEPDDMPRSESWYTRKEQSLKNLMNSSRDVKILWLSDKLSNMRSFYRMYRAEGDDMWRHFNQPDKKVQEWYYRSIADLLSELNRTAAYQEYLQLLNNVFADEAQQDGPAE